MTAEIIYLHHPNVKVKTNPQIIACDAVPTEEMQVQLRKLGFIYLPDTGEAGIFATIPLGWDEDSVVAAWVSSPRQS